MSRAEKKAMVRISTALVGSMIFLAGTMYFVKRHLPCDQVLERQLHFNIPEDMPLTEDQWRRFGNEQRDYLHQQAQQVMPLLARYVEIKIHDGQPVISVQLRCPSTIPGRLINEKVDNLLGVYAARRAEREAYLSAENSGSDFSLPMPTDIEKLKPYIDLHAQLQQQRADLQSRRLRLSSMRDYKSKQYPFSRLQKLLMAIAALAGFLAGLALPIFSRTTSEPGADPEKSYTPPLREGSLARKFSEPRPKPEPTSPEESPGVAEPACVPAELDAGKGNLKFEAPIEAEVALILPTPSNPITKAVPTRVPEVPTPADTPSVPVQLFINENDLKGGASFDSQSPAPKERALIYLQLFVDERDLMAVNALLCGQVQLYVNEQDLMAEPPRMVNQPLVAEKPAEPKPHINRMTPTIDPRESVSEGPPVTIQPVFTEHATIKPEASVMSEETCDITERRDQTISDEHQEMLLARVDLEKDHATAAEPGSPYTRLCEHLNRLRAECPGPVVVLSTLDPSEISPRFAVNLALSLAVKKLRVLLIEGDQAAADLAAIFEVPAKPGFFEWRRGELWASRVISATMLPGLSFMAAGEPLAEQSDNRTDLARETHRWANLRRNYDIIFIYVPGALSAAPKKPGQPVGSQLLDLADGMIAVIRLSSLSRRKKDQPPAAPDIPGQIQRIETVLETRRARFVGLIALKG
ncbi:MAG: hypothetical protein AMJ79_05755 [Phycisphaerae bacterium SM23_30]|nr:MAG: hypothetical protein AMJ79_05755 [Phycisphaerae bacterium SM23_30]